MVKLLKQARDPKVSIILPIYNSSLFLAESLKSILGQTYRDFELIAIDDGSSDTSLQKMRKVRDERVRIITHVRNRGLVSTLNEGMKKSRGEYIVRMDPDDIAEKNRIEKQVAYLDAHPLVDILGSWITVFGMHNYVWSVPATHDYIAAKLVFENSLPHPALIMRRHSILKTGIMYEEQYHGAEDYMLWSKLAEKGLRFANLQESLLRYRTHGEQVGVALRDKQQQSSWRIRKYNIQRLGITPTEEEKHIHQKLASWVPMKNIEETYKAGKWLLKLLRADNSEGIYAKHAFRKIIGERWTVMCYISAESNFKRGMLLVTHPVLLPLAIETLYLRARGRLYEGC